MQQTRLNAFEIALRLSIRICLNALQPHFLGWLMTAASGWEDIECLLVSYQQSKETNLTVVLSILNLLNEHMEA